MKSKTKSNLIFLWKIFIIILINILIILMAVITFGTNTVSAVTVGSEGNTVKEIQEALKYNGYYNGNVDGIFGNDTLNAVKNTKEKCIAVKTVDEKYINIINKLTK